MEFVKVHPDIRQIQIVIIFILQLMKTFFVRSNLVSTVDNMT